MVDLRILAVADFHGLPNADDNLSKFLQRGYDCLVLIGDLTNFGPVSSVDSMLTRIEAAGVLTLAVPGNCDPKPILEVLDKHGVNLHAKCMEFGDITFVGLGGSNLTPFNTPFEFTEAEIHEELAALTCEVNDRWVLVTHTPPYDTRVDRTDAGIHVGSKSIKQFIEQKQPLVALCGHVHEARNTDKLGRTLIINPGPINKGYAAEVVIGDGVCAKLLEV
ncbi:MAG: metallophosphoesterase family protein [Candidatus Hodarchaeaceae archaeon]|nr:metallophosphoesterase family protein [Candidatus Hodarchaeaceae archaeon]